MKTLQAKILDSTHLELSEPISTPRGQSILISIPIEEKEDTTDKATRAGSVAADDAPGLPGPGRSRELAWRRAHPEVLQSYTGEWVVLEGEGIIGHGPDPVEIVERARAQGIKIPYVFYVEELGPGIAKMSL